MFIYALALTFLIIPFTFRAYFNLTNGRIPLPKFQNNMVQSKIKTRRAMGVLYPIVFWSFHVFFTLWALDSGAWLAALAAIVYMVINPMLLAQIKAKGIDQPSQATPVLPDA